MRLLRFIHIFFLSVFVTSLLALGCLYIAERFFFDTFFYKKSITHGYISEGRDLSLYGKRGEDMLHLMQAVEKSATETQDLALANPQITNKELVIAVYGDSFTWGEGVRAEQRFVHLLEKKMNSIIPTKVLSFALPGDSLLDHYMKYRYVQKYYDSADVHVFALVANDLLFKKHTPYGKNEYMNTLQTFHRSCSNKSIYFNPLYFEQHEYFEHVLNSFGDEFANSCIAEKIFSQLPEDGTFFYLFTYPEETISTFFVSLMTDNQKLIDEKHKARGDYAVSQKEGHPSAEMHKEYAQVLFEHIVKSL